MRVIGGSAPWNHNQVDDSKVSRDNTGISFTGIEGTLTISDGSVVFSKISIQ